VVVERLAERGVTVDVDAGDRPDDVAWLSEALDRAAALDEPVDGLVDDDVDEQQTASDPDVDTAEQARARQEARAARRAEAARRQEEMAGHVRAAWPAERAEKVIASEAWPVLAYKLDQLDRAGYDVQAMLRAVPSFIDRAHTPAAYAYRVMDDAVTDMAAAERAQAAGARADERDQRTIDGDWRERAGAAHAAGDDQTARAAADRADTAYAAAERDADRAASHEERAAQIVAQGYPDRTDTAVAEAATAATAATSPGAARPARTVARPVTQTRGTARALPREPGGR
ncbi:hypothetical protein ACNTMW_30850, partial [Planosporangium sp. 12N6]|uniref:hypothetical protein n=1 Tax=Planosporangium spinosum TaxID=3402278 RepID=UPI003CE8F9C4